VREDSCRTDQLCAPGKGLENALEFVQHASCHEARRLAHSVPQRWDIIGRLEAKGVGLRIVNMGIDTGTSTGKLMLDVPLPWPRYS
jgi:DNA invertase Pin-like site-specific DNA recombinase